MDVPDYTFTEDQAVEAYGSWGCNCGPTALAFALQTDLDSVRELFPDFPGYTNPTAMRNALRLSRRSYCTVHRPDRDRIFNPGLSVVRVQWTGPWTARGANPKWAYRFTHWIATFVDRTLPMVFDVNGGIQRFEWWEKQTVPVIVEQHERADGGWYPTDCFQILGGTNHGV